jgi:hypothetical protein
MSTVHEDLCTFLIITRSVLLRMRNVSESWREYQNIQFIFNYFLMVPFVRQCGKYSTAGEGTYDTYIACLVNNGFKCSKTKMHWSGLCQHYTRSALLCIALSNRNIN